MAPDPNIYLHGKRGSANDQFQQWSVSETSTSSEEWINRSFFMQRWISLKKKHKHDTCKCILDIIVNDADRPSYDIKLVGINIMKS
jgi:hypothetical protein